MAASKLCVLYVYMRVCVRRGLRGHLTQVDRLVAANLARGVRWDTCATCIVKVGLGSAQCILANAA